MGTQHGDGPPALSLAFRLLDGFQDDIDALPLRVREAAVLVLMDVRAGRERGQQLDTRASTADLSDCRKIYFDPDPRVKARYRLVIRFSPNAVEAVAVEAVSVGKREGLDAYLRAARNLGRD